ncbi:MAG: uridine diphosphate-N-acetylglucosamine-binding protein YvcK [Patescibacteria group bacterium]|nr:uridine diphosphate-N-acetylglucosamine-binding protein YvcK [Patescibacteria group bacterium]
MKKSKKIVCLGGGNAMPRAVLAGLKKYPVEISVICAMLDSGGSAGRLRRDYNVVSPGDIRRAFIALANTSPVIKELFNYRFQGGELKGHNFANLLITALELSTNDYKKTIKEMNKMLNVKHQVLPVTLDKAEVRAILENGKEIFGEANIDIPKHNGKLKIKKLFLEPNPKAYPESLEVIKKADIIVIGPGDLYSSLAQILLTRGISRAIQESKAKKIYVCNLMTKYGETNDFSVLDFTKQVEKYLKNHLDFVIYNTKIPSSKRISAYNKKHPELLNLVNFDAVTKEKKKFLGFDLLTSSGNIIHDPNKLAKIIYENCF